MSIDTIVLRIRDFTLTSCQRGAYLHINRNYTCYNFGRHFLGHHYMYILGLSDLCLGVKMKIFKDFSLYMTYMATPLHKNPCPRGHKICNFS